MKNITLGKNDYININTDFNSAIIKYLDKTEYDTTNVLSIYINELQSLNNISILVSGGIDSEMLLYACTKGNIPFTAYTFRYFINKQIYNQHDLNDVTACESKYNFKTKYIDIDIADFLESEKYIEYAKKYMCQSPQFCVHLYGCDLIESNSFLILGGNGTTIFENNTLNFPPIKYICYDLYFQQRQGIGSFMSYSYDIMYSLLYNQKKSGLLFTRPQKIDVNYSVYDYDKKKDLYKFCGFDLLSKQTKFTGFEHIKQYYSNKYNEKGTIRTFDKLFRAPLKQIVKLPLKDNIKYSVPNKITELLNDDK